MIMLLIVAAVVFAYYGGASCPKVLKDNKQMLLGVVVGLLLGSFFGVRIEGLAGEVGNTLQNMKEFDQGVSGEFEHHPEFKNGGDN